LVKAWGIENAWYVDITIEYFGLPDIVADADPFTGGSHRA